LSSNIFNLDVINMIGFLSNVFSGTITSLNPPLGGESSFTNCVLQIVASTFPEAVFVSGAAATVVFANCYLPFLSVESSATAVLSSVGGSLYVDSGSVVGGFGCTMTDVESDGITSLLYS